jgi:hypothetical protein
MTAVKVPADTELEEDVVGAVLAGWLTVDLVPAGICYRPAHERILAAVRAGWLLYHYEVRGHEVVMTLGGIDLDTRDRSLAEVLATVAPVATAADVYRLVDLAQRRRVLLALCDAYDAIAAGEDVSKALFELRCLDVEGQQ